tara:strand:- start:641 stop:808 length:168 start_codon:yes stop_codon:yes gene_type:complete
LAFFVDFEGGFGGGFANKGTFSIKIFIGVRKGQVGLALKRVFLFSLGLRVAVFIK